MADVTRRDRAQLIIVTGFALAVTMILLALVLNSAIYTENLATREQEVNPSVVIGHQGAAEATTIDTITYINTHNDANESYPTLEQNLTAALGDWNNAIGLHMAAAGTSVTLEVETVNPGIRALQTNVSRNYTAGGSNVGDTNWTVAKDVTEIKNFTMPIRDELLVEATTSTTRAALKRQAFHVHIENSSNTSDRWNIYVFEGAITNTKYLIVESPNEDYSNLDVEPYVDWATQACGGTGNVVRLELLLRNFDGTRCSELDFVANLPDKVDIEFREANNASGTYELFVENGPLTQSNFYAASADTSPFTVTALYGANISHQYRNPKLNYSSTVEVVPPRRSAGQFIPGDSPTFTQLIVEDNSASDGSTVSFNVTWTVEDTDEDLKEVKTLLYSDENETLVDSVNVSVSGSSHGPKSVTLDNLISLDSDDEYQIKVVVIDEQGHKTPAWREQVADGDDST